jgi:hypothetical protein
MFNPCKSNEVKVVTLFGWGIHLGMQILGYKFWNVFDEMVLVT